jgi:hypothetical protein
MWPILAAFLRVPQRAGAISASKLRQRALERTLNCLPHIVQRVNMYDVEEAKILSQLDHLRPTIFNQASIAAPDVLHAQPVVSA